MLALERDQMDLTRDYDTVAAMHRTSLLINFGTADLEGIAFRKSLEEAIARGAVFAYRVGSSLYGWLWIAYLGSERAHIRQIEVQKRFWGQGIGKAIMLDAIAMAKEHRCSEMTLNVTKSNRRAVNLYTGLGFVICQDRGRRQLMRLDLITTVSRDQMLLRSPTHPER